MHHATRTAAAKSPPRLASALAAAPALLALALLLLLPAGQAWAQRNACNALDANNAATCSAAAYADGIVYDTSNNYPTGGIGSDVTLTVTGSTGGAATAITSRAPVALTWPNVSFAAGIVVRTAPQAMNAPTTETRNIALTVGTGTNAVAITQRTGVTQNMDFDNSGIFVQQIGARADTTTVTLGSGVTIGTQAAPMRRAGIHAQVGSRTNTGTYTINSAATIHSAAFGILMDNRGAGSSAITNSGSITTMATTGGTTGWASGIRVLDWGRGANPGNRTADSRTTVTNSGTITVRQAGGHGIEVDAAGLGLYRTVNSGTVSTAVSTTATALHGILVNAGWHTGAAGSTAIEIENSGSITTAADNAFGIFLTTLDQTAPQGRSNGAIAVTNSGSISSKSTAILVTADAGAITVKHSGGSITSENFDGIRVQQSGADATVESGAGITAKNYGIYLTNSRAFATVTATVAAGTTTYTGEEPFSDGAVSVTHSAGAIEAETESGIYAQNAAGNPDAVTVMVTGGSVKTEGQSKPAIQALQEGTGDAVAGVSSGATLTSKHNAGIYANLAHPGNDEGQVRIAQGGDIAARKGVYARVGRAIAADTTTRETRAAAEQPLIDVTWTGSFSHGTTAAVAPDDSGRFVAGNVASAIATAREVETEKAIRYGQAAGIEAQVMSWRDVMTAVATGDNPGFIEDSGEQANLLSETHADSRRADILRQFRVALENGDIDATAAIAAVEAVMPDGGTADGELSDAEIVAYLSVDTPVRRSELHNVLAQSFSDKEKAVLRAVVTDTGLTDALLDAALPAGATDEQKMAYRKAVRDLLKRYNAGNIRVAMTAGSIDSRGDGIRAYYATPNAMNGAISVSVAAGATVEGAMAGIYVANAGATGTGAERILKQEVTVNGMVTGGSDAAVHLVGGGTLTVGEMGELVAGSSGRAILVNEPGRSEIFIHGKVRGGSGATAAIETDGGGSITLGRTGSVTLADGASNAIDAKGAAGSTEVILALAGDGAFYRDNVDKAVERLGGRPGGGAIVGDALPVNADGKKTVGFALRDSEDMTGMVEPLPLGEDGRIDTSDVEDRPPEPMPAPPPTERSTMDCGLASDDRCRLYEALPSVLLAMNGLPSYGERLAAARSETGGWARVETSRGEWKAADSTRTEVAYDRDRSGVRAGVDMAVGEGARLGVQMHGLQGSADMTRNGGEVELSGMGIGASATAMAGGGVYIDVQAQATWFDVEVTSSKGTELMRTDEVDGGGWALALEAGRPMAAGGNLSLTPSLGLVWSQVPLDDFTDSRGTRVSMEDADSLVGRLGLAVAAEAGDGLRLFGSAAVMQEFSEDTEVQVPGTRLKASSETTGFRVAIGGVHSWGEGRYALQGSASYTSAGSGNSTVGGGLSLSISF